MTKELVISKQEQAQKALEARANELGSLQKRAEELAASIHNLKVQIATYNDLLTDDTAETSESVRETVETLVAGE